MRPFPSPARLAFPALPALPALLTLLGAPALAAAQSTLSVELAASNAYVWRGVTNANQPVLDPTVTLEVPVRHASLTLGGWANVESRRSDRPHDIGTLGGRPGPLVTQSQLWAELAGTRGATTISGGAATYLYPHVGDLATAYRTSELYGSVSREGLLSPSLTVYQDVHKVRGTYLEAGIAHDVPLGRAPALSLGAVMGVSAGMRERDGQTAYFARDGVTHVELSATTELARGSVGIAPTLHVVLASDPYARVASPDVQRTAKLWAGATVHWRRPLAQAVRVAPRVVPRVVRPVLLPPIYSDGGDEPEGAAGDTALDARSPHAAHRGP